MAESPPFREVLPKKGLLYQESNPQMVLCKPKLLPLKSFTLEKLEKMQKEASSKAQEQLVEQRKYEDEERITATSGPVQSETISFE